MKRLYYIIAALLLISLESWAVKADYRSVEIRQPDGTFVSVVLHGDEFFHYYTTDDGVLLVQSQGAYYIASTDAEGKLSATSLLAHNRNQRSENERKAVAAQDVDRFIEEASTEAAIRRSNRREPIAESESLFPHSGSPRAIVILAEFEDVRFTIEEPQRSFDAYFNSHEPLVNYGRKEDANISSVSKYFSDVSFEQFVPQFDVYGPVQVPNSLSHYGGTTSGGDGENMPALFQDACSLMDETIDYSQYDANDDGRVDLVIIIYAGYSEAMSGNSTECIWPKSGSVAGGTYDGKKVSRYAVSAELNGFPGCFASEPLKRINGIGTMCHEFCHTLGLPDFYPTYKDVKGNNQGMEYWSLMDSGNYLTNGYTPVALNAWEREALGWIDIPTLDETQDLTLTPLDAGGKAYRILNDHDSSGHEYFIIENIQKDGYNYAQKGHGMLVYHVDYDPTRFTLVYNNVNNEPGHPRMTVVPADNCLFAQYNVGKTIDGVKIINAYFYNELAGDPFPGSSNVGELTDMTGHVNFKVYNGDILDKGFCNIVEDETGVISLSLITNYSEYYALGISDISYHQQGEPEHIYTLDGRRTTKSRNGIYIVKTKDGKTHKILSK